VSLAVNSGGRLDFFLLAWPETPDSGSHAVRLKAILDALGRRLGPPRICGRSAPPWQRTYVWQTDLWMAELGRTRNVTTEGPSSVQFQGRFKAPTEYITCMEKSVPEA
jgi:hypothetical protein